MNDLIKELREQRKPKSSNVDSLIEKIYTECLNNIKFKNKHGITSMIYEVPRIYIGFPLYDIDSVSYKLNKLLKSKGFITTLNKNRICISWK